MFEHSEQVITHVIHSGLGMGELDAGTRLGHVKVTP
jgi:hypothetical protein